MRLTALCVMIGLWVLSACTGGTSGSPTNVAVGSTPPTSVGPTSTAGQLVATASSRPVDVQPTPEGLRRLTNDPARDETPAWSPDGQRIAFSSDRTGVYELYTSSADGGTPVQLTQDEGTFLKDDPTWSPDGSQIAFTFHSDLSRVYAVDVRQAEALPFDPMKSTAEGFPEPLSDNYADASSPSWSPDGRRIALIMYDLDLRRQLFGLDLASEASTQLSHVATHARAPSWSPNGRWIAFSAETDGNEEIYLIGADGDNLVRLTDNPAYDSWPSWSPDGQFLVFSSNRAGSLGLHLIRSDGTYISLLDTGPGEAFDPSWSPDGRYVAFVSDRDGNAELYRIDAPVLAP